MTKDEIVADAKQSYERYLNAIIEGDWPLAHGCMFNLREYHKRLGAFKVPQPRNGPRCGRRPTTAK